MKRNTSLKKYENVISLGSFCGPAMEIERIGLHSASFPFDWLIVSSFATVLQLIENNFSGFLTEENLFQEVSIYPEYYYDATLGIHFYHDFSKHKSLHEQIDSVQEKYRRRIKRFYDSIKKPTLFIRYCSKKEEIDYIKENFKAIDEFLKSYHPENAIIYITDLPEEHMDDLDISVYTVQKDKGDTVARKFLRQCPDLRDFLLEQVNANRKKNLKVYRKNLNRKIRKKIWRTIEKLDRKCLKLFGSHQNIYKHDKTI